jgi:deoxyribonuclease-4
MVDTFDRHVGLRWLRALHLNDSKSPLGSRLDRHENIGEGYIGRAGFRAVLGHPALRDLPGLIETPGFNHHGPDRRNVMALKRLRAAGRALPAGGRRSAQARATAAR